MSEPKWTKIAPAPWKYEGGGILTDAKGHNLAYLAGRLNAGSGDAVGDLLAAAAQLYEALAELIAIQDQMGIPPKEGGGVFPADYRITRGKAHAALAKACGDPQ